MQGAVVELSWQMKIRIGAAVAVGVLLIGVIGWPLGAPVEPFGVVSIFAGDISFGGVLVLLGLAFLAGFLGYFVSWPWGKEIGVLAVPAGLSVWAVRGGSMANLMLENSTTATRGQLFATLKWEPLFWLAVVAAGWAGVLVGQKLSRKKIQDKAQDKTGSRSTAYLNAAAAFIGSGLIALFGIRILAQNVRAFDSKLGSVMAQPAVGQIAFAVLVSFGLAAFVVKKFLDADYIWPVIVSAFITAFGVIGYAGNGVLQHVVEHWPAIFFSNSIIAILPVQMVAFGTLGSVCGYWIAIRYTYWRKHEV